MKEKKHTNWNSWNETVTATESTIDHSLHGFFFAGAVVFVCIRFPEHWAYSHQLITIIQRLCVYFQFMRLFILLRTLFFVSVCLCLFFVCHFYLLPIKLCCDGLCKPNDFERINHKIELNSFSFDFVSFKFKTIDFDACLVSEKKNSHKIKNLKQMENDGKPNQYTLISPNLLVWC